MDGSELASSENQVRGYMALCHVLSSDLTRQMGQVQVLPRVWVHVGALELAPARGMSGGAVGVGPRGALKLILAAG
jgi:hypothetical protein